MTNTFTIDYNNGVTKTINGTLSDAMAAADADSAVATYPIQTIIIYNDDDVVVATRDWDSGNYDGLSGYYFYWLF